MARTTFSGPVQSLNGFIDANGDPIGGGATAPVTVPGGGAATNIDFSTGTQFATTLSTNTTFSFSNFPAGSSLTITITQDALGGKTATFTGVKFPGGFPGLSLPGNSIDVVSVYNDGTNLLANIGKDYS